MRTLNWYDVKWSKTSVAVNEEYEITGKVYVMNAWPTAVPVPDNACLSVGSNAGTLGPVATSATPRPAQLELGKTYKFRIVQRARRPGHWHTHVQLSVKSGGPIPGPGQYIDIKGNFADYTDEVKLLNGSTVDLEKYGIGKIYLWHIVWAIAGCAWFWYHGQQISKHHSAVGR